MRCKCCNFIFWGWRGEFMPVLMSPKAFLSAQNVTQPSKHVRGVDRRRPQLTAAWAVVDQSVLVRRWSWPVPDCRAPTWTPTRRSGRTASCSTANSGHLLFALYRLKLTNQKVVQCDSVYFSDQQEMRAELAMTCLQARGRGWVIGVKVNLTPPPEKRCDIFESTFCRLECVYVLYRLTTLLITQLIKNQHTRLCGMHGPFTLRHRKRRKRKFDPRF